MEEDAVHFYNNKVRLIIGFIFITALFSGILCFHLFHLWGDNSACFFTVLVRDDFNRTDLACQFL